MSLDAAKDLSLQGLYRPPDNGLGVLDWLASYVTGHSRPDRPVSDWTIFLPNQRASNTFRRALLTQSSKSAVVLPRIITLGNLSKFDALSLGAHQAVDLAEALPASEKIAVLTHWVQAYFNSLGQHASATQILSMAESLADLIDEADNHIDVDWSKLGGLADDAELAEHWQDSVKFLKIVTETWPAYLQEIGRMTVNTLRINLAQCLAQHWTDTPTDSPVVIAGSMGTNASTRLLMEAVSHLPRGLVILPDCPLDTDTCALEALSRSPHHPHAALSNTLLTLGQTPASLSKVATHPAPRRQFIETAFAIPEAVGVWHQPHAYSLKEAISGIYFAPADTAADEALNAALIIKHTLESGEKTSVFVTPDAALARRVQVALFDMGVDVPTSQGSALLNQTSAQFWILLANWLTDPADQIGLSKLLQHPYFKDKRDAIYTFDKCVLRTPRNWTDLSGLEDIIADWLDPRHMVNVINQTDADTCWQLLNYLREALPEIGRSAKVENLVTVGERLVAADILWTSESAAVVSEWLESIATQTQNLSTLSYNDISQLLEAHAAKIRVPDPQVEHARIKIYGALEARLVSADVVILGGLVEGKWPAHTSSSSFLPSHFRPTLGLPAAEVSIGLSARDVFSLLECKQAYLSWSARDGDALNAPSPWVQRLQTCAQALNNGEPIRFSNAVTDALPHWAEAYSKGKLDPIEPIAPAPAPQQDARPKVYSNSDIESLVNDPYAFYARRILGLRPLNQIAPSIGANIYGSLLHAHLETFENTYNGRQTQEDFTTHFGARLAEIGYSEAKQLSLTLSQQPGFAAFLEWRGNLDLNANQIEIEQSANLHIEIDGINITLKGRADRVHEYENGFEIIDYKSGKPPSEKRLTSGLSPQLALLGLMFENKKGQKIQNLGYIRVARKYQHKDFKNTATDLVDQARAGLPKLLSQYMSPAQAYLPANTRIGAYANRDYAHLSRRAEWSGQNTQNRDEI